MAVAFRLVYNQWGNPTVQASITSGSASVNSGDTTLAFGAEYVTSGAQPTISGTGGTFVDQGDFPHGADQTLLTCYTILSTTMGLQTVTVTAGSGTAAMDGWALLYTGVVGIASATDKRNVTPGTGAGAIVGNTVNVPTGSVLVALCMDLTQSSTSITNTAGTSRQSGNGASTATTFNITDYAGAGANITPAFTDSTNGGTHNYDVVQILLSPTAIAGNPFEAQPLSTLSSHPVRDLGTVLVPNNLAIFTDKPIPLMGQCWT